MSKDVISLEDIQAQESLVEAIKTQKDRSDTVKTQQFQMILNREPHPDTIATHKQTGVPYLPISHVEMTMDEWFFGLWNTANCHIQLMLNHVVVTMEVTAKHPVTGDWLTRSGVGATKIRQKSGSKVEDFAATMIGNALEMDAPKAKAQAFTNAAASLGKLLGRDIARDIADTMQPVVKPDSITPEMKKHISKIKSVEELDEFVDKNEQFAEVAEFYTAILTRRHELEGE